MSAQGTGGGHNRWLWALGESVLQWEAGVCPVRDSQPLAYLSPSPASLGKWRASTKNTVQCSPAAEGDEGHRWPRAKVHRDSKIQSKAKPSPHTGGKLKRTKNLFRKGLPWACPQPVPTDLGAGPGLGSQRTHLLPLLSAHRQVHGH